MKTFVEQNHYEFLGVEPDAGPEEIRRAVAKLREIFAPGSIALYSLVDQEEHKALLERLEEAAVVLADERARLSYDERHGLGRKPAEPPRRVRPGPGEQLQLAEIVGAVDEAPAWPGARPAGDGEGPGTAESSPAPAEVELLAADAATAEPAPAPALPTPTPAADEAAVVAASDDFEVDLEELAVAPADSGPSRFLALVPRDRPRAPAPPAAPAPPVDLPPMPELGPNTEYTGALLRRIREARGLTVRDLAAKTRISAGQLEHLEAEAFAQLPERVYLRGFLTAYARELKLDGARLAETYLARRAAARRE